MKRLLQASLIAGTSFLAVSTAQAACSCGGVQNIVSRAQDNINSHTTSVGQQIADTILKGVAQLSAYQTRSDEANKRVQDSVQMAETIRQRQLARAAAEGGRYDPAVSACVDLSGIFSMGRKSEGATGYGGNDVSSVIASVNNRTSDVGSA